jgi:hypothetical protein
VLASSSARGCIRCCGPVLSDPRREILEALKIRTFFYNHDQSSLHWLIKSASFQQSLSLSLSSQDTLCVVDHPLASSRETTIVIQHGRATSHHNEEDPIPTAAWPCL